MRPAIDPIFTPFSSVNIFAGWIVGTEPGQVPFFTFLFFRVITG